MARISGLVSGLVPELKRAIEHFPWSVAAASAFALYFLLGLNSTPGWYDPDNVGRVPAALTAAFLWALIAALFAQSRGLQGPVRHGLALAGFLVIALLAAAHRVVELHIGFMLASLTLGVGVAAYLRRNASQRAFWRFNHDAWVGAVVAAIATILFGGGLSAIVETLRYLFGIDISYKAHEKIWAIACGLVGPIYWLGVIPEDLDAEVTEGPQTEFISRMIALLGRFLLVPLLLVYALILHAYAIKIGVEWSLPKGRLGWMVLTYGTLVVATALVIFPTRQSGGTLPALFWRLWPYLLLVPLAMLYIAIGRRIGEYGLTQQRYTVLAAGLWLTLVAAWHGLGVGWRDLRAVPALLAGILAVAAIGPWGVQSWPVRSQVGHFSAILAKHDVLRDGRVAPAADIAAKLPTTDLARLAGIVDHLNGTQKIHRLRPLFSGDAADPFAGTQTGAADGDRYVRANYDWTLGQRIKDRLGILKGSLVSDRLVSFHANTPGVFQLDGGRLVIGPVTFHRGATPKSPVIQNVVVDGRIWTIALDGSMLTIESPDAGRNARFELASLVTGRGTTTRPGQKPNEPIVLKSIGGTMPAMLIVSSAGLTRAGVSDVVVNYVTMWIHAEP